MSTVSIIGLGTMARSIATRALASGNAVELIGRDPAKTAALAASLSGDVGGDVTTGTLGQPPLGEIVILALPYDGSVKVVSEYGDSLSGKVIVDICNPFNRTTLTDLVTPDGSSAAQEIAAAAPGGAHVVKAFNTLFSTSIDVGQAHGRPVDVFIAGDDADAKKAVSAFIESLGLRPLDTGELKTARWLEGLGLLVLGQGRRTGNYSLAVGILD
ncbi:NADPH-dependent F420 reductase [Catenulispora rubra]|uniref:NADPH-dependent F420 reductase n=1 Tax=Catenulispora rubra TaxID=280293 RepID=UPI0018921BB9|nr:NAD(P)-binding domain-containing protein [Catenulispora rubra]